MKWLNLGLVVVAVPAMGCEPCYGKEGAELEECEAKEAAGGETLPDGAPALTSPTNPGISTTDDTPMTCTDLGTLDSQSLDELELGKAGTVNDTVDWFCFELDSPARVTVVSDEGRANPRLSSEGAPTEFYGTDVDLDAGAHFVGVFIENNCCGYNAFPYTLTLDVAPYADVDFTDDGGSSPADAEGLDIAAGGFAEVAGYVGLSDPFDYYRVTVPDGQVGVAVVESIGEARTGLTVYEDTPAVLGEPLQGEVTGGNGDPGQLMPFGPGTFLLEVQAGQRTGPGRYSGTAYELTVQLNDAGE